MHVMAWHSNNQKRSLFDEENRKQKQIKQYKNEFKKRQNI